MDKEASTWTLMDYVFDPTRTRLILQVHVQHSNWLEIIVHLPNKKQEAPTGSWQSMLLQLVTPTKTSSKDDAHGIIKRILQLCRDRYAQGWPLFGNSIYVVDGAGEPELLEAMESELELALRAAPRLETDGYSIPLTPRQDMQPAAVEEGSFMPQTKPVWFQGKLCVAKGPASAERAHLDLREVSNLCSLPTRHPNIIPPPLSLLTLSETDKTICGFLFPLYKHGNLDLFALKMCREDSHFSHILRAWYRQLASAVKSLIDADTYHGDIKPDNILVSDANELILIDLARSFTTLSIAGPEVVEAVHATGKVQIPSDWSISEIEKAEVYSIGRTMFFVSEGVSMSDVYHKRGPENGEFPTQFSADSSTPVRLQKLILSCVKQDPLSRPSLVELIKDLDSIDLN